MKMLKVTIAGYYKSFDGETVDFADVSGTIPHTTEEHAAMHVRGRYAKEWVKTALGDDGKKKYTKSVDTVPVVYIDAIEEVEGTPSFVGKDIKTLSVMELQDLATAKDLREIKLPQDSGDKRLALATAYQAYSKHVLDKELKPKLGEEGFNFAKLPSIILDPQPRLQTEGKLTNEQILELEQQAGKPQEMGRKDDPKARLTLKDLKKVADESNIEYDKSMDSNKLYDFLYQKVFGQSAA